MSKYSHLFSPLRVGALQLKHRVVMAPLTRMRSTQPGDVPNDLMATYYGQRASDGGLIITEATQISLIGKGYPAAPGVHSAGQVEGWKKVVEVVHAKGGFIFLQLWHVGRISHSSLHPKEGLPVAPSAIAPAGTTFSADFQRVPFETPRALELAELPGVVAEYRKAAENAKAAGFDGVEIHGANGYLLDQFLQDSTNKRTDAYGGPIENRARLLLEVTDAVVSVWGAGRVGVHLAPRADAHDMGDSDLPATFGYVARELGKRKIAFLCARESATAPRLGPTLKKEFGGVFVANEGFDKAGAEAVIGAGEADAVAFGKLFIANPDLPQRFALGAPLNRWNSDTFYSEGPAGYTDYPALRQAAE